MKRRPRLASIFLIVLTCLLMPFFSAYLDYFDLADADFPSRDRSFENPDQVNLFVAQQNEPRLSASGLFPIALRPGIDLLEPISRLIFQTPSSDQGTTILRC